MTSNSLHDSPVMPSLQRLATSQLPFKTRLMDRLQALVTAFSDDYPGCTVSMDAFDALLSFLETSASPGYPDLTMTPAGKFYAEWRGPENRLLTIEFLESGDARYLLFRPNPKHPQRIDRLTGLTTADALVETITPLAPMTGLAA